LDFQSTPPITTIMHNIELIPPKRKLNLSMSSNDLKPFGMLKANSNKVTLSSIKVSFS
jgi:hypothetical protein